MFLVCMFLAAFARSLASPTVSIPASPIPSPLCVVSAAVSAGTCNPNKRRTTFDILYSCLSVIFLCTYTSIHHNIPDQNDSSAKKSWQKVRTMLYAMLAPEVVIMWALRQRIMAEEIAGHSWNVERKWTRTHGFLLKMGGLMMKKEDGTFEVLTSTSGLSIPAIRLKEIADHGKGDILAKSIAVLQTSWFLAQCIARHVEGLALTELELVTLAFSVLNFVTYLLWWDKPLNVNYPIYFDATGNRVDGPEDLLEESLFKQLWALVKGSSDTNEQVVSSLVVVPRSEENDSVVKRVWENMIKKPITVLFNPLLGMVNEDNSLEHRRTSVPLFYAAWLDIDQLRVAYYCASVIGVIFGAIHLIGWNLPFLTTTERWLWRTSSLVLTIAPAFIPLSWRFIGDPDSANVIGEFFGFLVTRVAAPLYIVARVIILFLAFFALRDLPDSAYENIKWSNFIPHF